MEMNKKGQLKLILGILLLLGVTIFILKIPSITEKNPIIDFTSKSAKEFCEEHDMNYTRTFRYYCVKLVDEKYIEKEIKQLDGEWGFVE